MRSQIAKGWDSTNLSPRPCSASDPLHLAGDRRRSRKGGKTIDWLPRRLHWQLEPADRCREVAIRRRRRTGSKGSTSEGVPATAAVAAPIARAAFRIGEAKYSRQYREANQTVHRCSSFLLESRCWFLTKRCGPATASIRGGLHPFFRRLLSAAARLPEPGFERRPSGPAATIASAKSSPA